MTEETEWIEWAGGERPVDRDTLVELRLRSPSAWDDGDYADGRPARQFFWDHGGDDSDIIAYRIVKEPSQ